MASTNKNDEKDGREQEAADRLEWAVGIVSGLIVLAILAFLAYDGIVGSSRPPELTVDVLTGEGGPTGGHLRFVVRNSGDLAASAVVVSALVRGADGSEEKFSVTLDYVPAGAEARGGFVIPEGGEADLMVEGYVDP